ncbi:MAG: Indole-3-glycerol phosphate synthase [Verrucomicrobiales bacterium]|nr:Indole-3-glycerol phosphate synthase [Verrucomicrobiales bacterium]
MNILDTIVQHKQIEVAALTLRPANGSSLKWAMQAAGHRRDFAGELRFPRSGKIALIAEVKKASPSAGIICHNFDPIRIAREYEAAGASCLSVLTDEKFFQGSLHYLRNIREAVSLPLLRKDFIIHERQILESIEWGADAILLIVSILTDEQLEKFLGLAAECALSALVEVHDETELARALKAGAKIIGINNRDLKTFQVDLATSERIAGRIRSPMDGDASILIVAESGIRTPEDVQRLGRAGANGILVGESLMKEHDVGAKIQDLLGFGI